MNLEQLLEFLQIEDVAEFEYFENFADLVETEEDIKEDALYQIVTGCDNDNLAEIIDNYFNEIMDAVPDDSTELYTLLETIKMSLIGLINSSEEVSKVHFCEELLNFKNWYSRESIVYCKNIDSGDIQKLPMRDALSLSRIEKLEGDKYHYDFEDCLNYEMEEYIMSYADMAKAARDEADDVFLEDNYDDIDDYEYNRG